MTNSEAKALEAKEKMEVRSSAEQTTPGPVFTPSVDIFETEQELTLLADMPGVNAEGVNIDLRENILTLSGDVKMPEGEKEIELIREYRTGRYLREFTLSENIDQSKIEAEIREGVLQLKLPKAEAAKPRKISVKTG
jgi:HSP20 family molecular chaperone IbpA